MVRRCRVGGGIGSGMRVARDILAGAVLAALVWAFLEGSQVHWSEAMNRAPVSDLIAPSLVLVLVGALLAGLVLSPASPWTSGTAAVLLTLVVAPLVAGTGASWWPDGWPGSPLRLAAFTGTYLAIGVLAAVTIVRIRSATADTPSGRTSGPHEPSDEAPMSQVNAEFSRHPNR